MSNQRRRAVIARQAHTAAGLVLDRFDAWRHRSDRADADLLAEPMPRLTIEDRTSLPFDRERVLRAYGRTTEIEGRRYPYVVVPGRGPTLCIHYSAFFGEWGDRRQTRAQFAGWFHRLRMFWPLAQHSFLFLCDTYGADANGTYYKGVDGDFFVERAIRQIQRDVASRLGVAAAQTVTAGSSMGATAALRFALQEGYAGVVAVSPHIDLDISALRQDRLRHVSAIFGREDIDSPDLTPVTREIAELAGTVRPLPRLVVQSTLDDAGVHSEQVLPLVRTWQAGGGELKTDFHGTGGHTSEYATPEFFAHAFAWCLASNMGDMPTEESPGAQS